jgi:ATP-dependent Clp protease ATP-binding subunit ClpC
MTSKDVNETLKNYSSNLTNLAKKNTFFPVVGRNHEINKLTTILLKRTKRNALLIGSAGVGKTAIVEELARQIVAKECHYELFDKELLLLDSVGIMAGTQERGEYEKRVRNIIKAIEGRDNIILMIDEIHSLVTKSVSSSSTKNPLLDMFKPGLARGSIQCIGTTTYDEYIKYFVKDSAFERRFQPINVLEPSEEETLVILNSIKPHYEEYHKCTISDEALYTCIYLGTRYLYYRNFPDKAIDLMDEACSKVNIQHHKHGRKNRTVDSDDIISVMNDMIQENHSLKTEKERVVELEQMLRQEIIGQENVITTVVNAFRRNVCGFYPSNRPICSFLFAGPTGTGKTETAKLVHTHYFENTNNKIIRFDMSEYSEAFDVSKLIGSPPGFIGYEEGGLLTNEIKKNPRSVVLFDEIEKAHPSFFDLLLQILDYGVVTDNKGISYSFNHCVIIMTSNIGFTHSSNASIGFDFNDAEQKLNDNNTRLMSELKHYFRPEFMNRIDNIVVFNYLSENDIEVIANKMIFKCIEKIRIEHDINVVVSFRTRNKIIEQGMNTSYGARPLRTAINIYLLDIVSQTMLTNEKQKTIYI